MPWLRERQLPGPYTGPPSTNFYRLDKRLQALETKIVYCGVPNRETAQRPWWDLWPSGKQGIQLAPQVAGLQHLPFTGLLSEGAYTEGATPQRTTVDKRPVKWAVMVNVNDPDTIFRYRMLEQRWWASWSRDEDGYIGVYTRTHGWRWCKARLAKAPETVMDLDPQAFDANFMQWDMEILVAYPYWQKRLELASWKNEGDGAPHTPWQDIVKAIADAIRDKAHDILPNLIPGVDVAEGNLIVPTRGTQPEWPKFLVSSPGVAWIEDGPGGHMVQLPLLRDTDGTVLVDTNPVARTLTATTDPIDRLFFRIARNSQLLDFLLHDQLSTTLPVWQRFNGRFTTPWPARTVNRIKVRHSQLGGQVVVHMPQRYESAYGT